MRLTITREGEVLRCVEDRAPVGRRYVLPYPEERVAAVRAELLGALERANHARSLSAANLENLRVAGEELGRLLLPGEILARLRSTMGRMTLVLDAELAPIPWELLYDGEQFLCRRFDLGRLLVSDWEPKAKVWRPMEVRTPLRMLVVCADPAGDLDRLEQECGGLLEALDGSREKLSVRVLRAQNLDSVRRALKDYDFVHLAGHADFDPDDPGGAGFLLPDGKLTAADITHLGSVRPMPLLVFSNACQSGITGPWGPERQGRVLGMAGAFLLSGARFYLGTQWELVDTIGARVAVRFYEALVQGANVGAALRAARQREVEEEGEASLGWASYVLYGDPSWVPLPTEARASSGSGGNATARLGHRATLPWKRRRGAPDAPDAPDEEDDPGGAELVVAGPWPPWLVAGLMVVLLLAAASLGAWIYRLLAG